ncbi:MlaC/ttg2D family ABC transporter substrate-binding protein [Pelagicoccus mobilis]|uniref:ABC transporter substrate-binding protein n=1 Tax=Pelagicoccus mobilis TaxID=415221 RepID=A0A934VPB7_9BACT|nr:ABC transporter substrate-binding protein [Pelagicoccus mobilis]MBK1877117.1 ABC transporter substrate-binding protein [Pelagicoccus mobilis]
MRLTKPSTIVAIFLAILTAGYSAIAKLSPQEQLQASISEVIEILHSGSDIPTDEKRALVLEQLQTRFSFDIIIRRTLGRNWNRLDESQQDRITILITDLLIKTYTAELASGEKPQVNFLKTEDLDSNKIEIHTSVTYKNALVSVNYRLANIKSRGWQVYDVLVEGTSIVSNYRGQIDEHFQTKSAEELLDVIASKIENYDSE